MKKVLIHNNEYDEIHYIESDLISDTTLCGQSFNRANAIMVKRLDVTCVECLKLFAKKGK